MRDSGDVVVGINQPRSLKLEARTGEKVGLKRDQLVERQAAGGGDTPIAEAKRNKEKRAVGVDGDVEILVRDNDTSTCQVCTQVTSILNPVMLVEECRKVAVVYLKQGVRVRLTDEADTLAPVQMRVAICVELDAVWQVFPSEIELVLCDSKLAVGWLHVEVVIHALPVKNKHCLRAGTS